MLEQGHLVILDATFVYQRHRDLAISLAHEIKVPLVVIQCVCEPSVVKRRLEKRLKEKSVSDGRWEIYQHQINTMDPYEKLPHYIEFNTGKEDYKYRMQWFNKLVTLVKKVSG